MEGHKCVYFNDSFNDPPLTFVFFVFFRFLLGFSIRCETTVTWDFAKVTKMARGGKTFFLFGYILLTNRET